jgi:hypothetical protein
MVSPKSLLSAAKGDFAIAGAVSTAGFLVPARIEYP